MGYLEVIARAKIRPGQLEGFRAQAAEILRLTRERDTHTLRCDWFVEEDGTECEVHEMFPDEQGLIEHKMNTMEATIRLFSDYASDHESTLYGEVSQDFLNLVKERMGAAPAVFSFFQGVESPARGAGHFEVIARLKVRPGQLEGFKAQAAEVLRLTGEKDTQTVRYDWFIDADGTECEVHEAYLDERGLIEHNMNVVEARDILFEKYAYDHRMSVYGEVSQEIRNLAKKHAGGARVLSFLGGLEASAAA